jgi:membrane protein DedA with SNARE-associated domain
MGQIFGSKAIMLEPASFINHFPYLGIFLLLILGEIGFPFPEDATLILTGFLTAHALIKPLPAFLVLYVGLLTTDFSLYFVGKKYGRSIVEHKRFHKIISLDRLSKLEKRFRKWGGLVVFLGRHIWGLRAQIFLVAGVMKISATKFLVADAISAIFSIGLWGGIGYLGGNSLQVLKKDVTRIEHIGVVVLVLLLLGGIFFRYFKNYRKAKTKSF